MSKNNKQQLGESPTEAGSSDPSWFGLASRAHELSELNDKLRESQANLEEAQRIARIGHWKRDVATGVLTWSDEVYRMFGLKPQEVRITFQDFLSRIDDPADRQRVAEIVAEAVQKVSDYEFEFKIRRADGETRLLRSEGHVSRDHQSGDLQAFGIVQDITERTRKEETLRQSERRLRSVIDTLPAMAWMLFPDGRVDFMNKRWLEYVGQSLEEFALEPFAPIHPEDRPRVAKKFGEMLAAKRAYEDEMRLRRSDGEYRWFLLRTVPSFDEAGNLHRWYGISADIQERKEAEQALAENQSILGRITRATVAGELTASIAHEINQPLGAIVANASAALRWLTGNEPNLAEGRNALERIIRDGNRASEVVGRIRALLKKGAPMRKRIAITDIVRETVLLIEADAMRRGARIQLHVSPESPEIIGDPIELQQVLMNLVMNALEAVAEVPEENRRVTISVQTGEGNLLDVRVADAGVGIHPDRISAIFEPFQTTKEDGLGLGLAISRSIIERHGGRIDAIPNDGPGMTFRLTLPAAGHGSNA